MKKLSTLLIIFLLLLSAAQGQTIYPIRADTVNIHTGSTVPGAGGELRLQNASRTVVNGLLTNTNFRGNTEFRKLVLNYTKGAYTGGGLVGILDQDTIVIPDLKPYMDTMYLNAGNLLYQKNGNTYTVVLPTAPVITADNFLTKTGNNIQLGGNSTIAQTTLNALLNNFKISGNDNLGGTSVFELNGSASTGFQQVVNRGSTASGFNNFYNTFDINSGTVSATNSLLRATPTSVLMQLSNATLNTTFSISTGANLFNDGLNAKGISYGNNYAANNTTNDRWIPDKKYVDSTVAAGGGPSFSAGNLLTLAAGNIFELGGTATKPTLLNLGTQNLLIVENVPGGGNSQLQFSNIGTTAIGNWTATLNTENSQLQIEPTQANLSYANTTTNNIYSAAATASGSHLFSFDISAGLQNTFLLNDVGTFHNDARFSKGISYGNNYAANNTANDRWLPDKRYVDSTVAAGGGGSYTADNLLTLSGTAFELGGAATRATTLTLGTETMEITQNLGTNGTSTSSWGTNGNAPVISVGTVKNNENTSIQMLPTGMQMSYLNTGTTEYSSYEAGLAGIVISSRAVVNKDATLYINSSSSTFDDQAAYRGLSYGDNYAANASVNPRWLTDKNYVDSSVIHRALRFAPAATTFTVTDYTIVSNGSTAVAVNLPDATQIYGRVYVLKKTSATGINITLTPFAGQFIDTATTQVLTTQYSSIMVQSDGANWVVISSHVGGSVL